MKNNTKEIIKPLFVKVTLNRKNNDTDLLSKSTSFSSKKVFKKNVFHQNVKFSKHVEHIPLTIEEIYQKSKKKSPHLQIFSSPEKNDHSVLSKLKSCKEHKLTPFRSNSTIEDDNNDESFLDNEKHDLFSHIQGKKLDFNHTEPQEEEDDKSISSTKLEETEINLVKLFNIQDTKNLIFGDSSCKSIPKKEENISEEKPNIKILNSKSKDEIDTSSPSP